MEKLTFSKVIFSVLFLSFGLLSSCSKEELDPLNLEAKPSTGVTATQEIQYKGIYASKSSNTRGIVELSLIQEKENPANIISGKAKLTLSTGTVVEADMTDSKSTDKASEDFNVSFDSNDMSFNFYLDANGVPVVADVVYKQQEGAVVVAEHSSASPVTPITGIYRCTNCEDQTSTLNGIELNNEDRIFNMLLTTKDGQTGMTIQAVLGSLVNAELVVEQACSTDAGYTFCTLQTGAKATTEPVQWSGIHRYTTDSSSGDACSTIWGDLVFNSPENGIIEAEFQSDNTCPNNTYYVSATGDDSNSGLTPEDAWKTILKVNSVTAKPGDRILFEGGRTFNGSLKFTSEDANGGNNPVTISSYGTGEATIFSGNQTGIDIYNTAGFRIENLIVTGNASPELRNSGIQFYTDLDGDVKLDFAEIKNVKVHGFSDYGIVFGSWKDGSINNAGFKNIVVENAKVYNILNVGIGSYGNFSASKTGYAHANISVRNCEVFNITGNSTITHKHSGNGILLSDVQNSVIEYSTVYNSGQLNANPSGGPVGIWYWDADQVTIQHNEVYGMKSGTSKDGGGFDLDGGVTNGIMQYNYSHDNYGAGYLIGQFTGARPMRNITVRYNISENDAATNGGSIYLFNGASPSSMRDIWVYNNTLYIKEKPSNSGAAGIKLLQWKTMSENINFHNNIIVAEDGADLVQVPAGYKANFSGNLYHSTTGFSVKYQGMAYSSLTAFRATGNEFYNEQEVGIEADPLLSNPGNGGIIGFGNALTSLTAYKLSYNSPAIDAGIKLSQDMGEQDFYNNVILTDPAPEMGAHGNLSQEAVASN
ncbi:right-handed parallel beta-helix repeat-containing protein [Salinimicrobium oceani]|nr:right-handed parallel beta-helix repeat-containing protein [Salinimicrobium oceani]